MPHVLVADGDGTSLQHTAVLLEQARYQVSRASDGRSALRVVTNQTPDLVVLEALLPDQEGFELCRRIRRTSDVPIMFLANRARAEDRVLGLRLGADDYLSKPCAPAELLARVGAVLRRAERARRPPTTPLNQGGWVLDPLKQVCVTEEGRGIDLTPREVHLLAFLMKRSGRVCSSNQIIRHVWGFAPQQARSIVATSVWRLRAKLERDPQNPRHLLTIRHIGYKFDPALA
ncbi:MAG: response regulator transcription factor [Chloroflexi bacterium SZAS-1]|nr:response regulator transcription factor [Chloroflexi bacterium SZAS-1]